MAAAQRQPVLGAPIDAKQIAAAALLGQVFALYLVVLRFAATPTEYNWQRADPILKILPRNPTLWLVPIASLVVAALWWRWARPRRKHMKRAMVRGAAGAVAAIAAVGALRLAAGPEMPSFIPAEESAGPGYLLSMTAGYAEELGVRLLILPAVYFACVRKLPRLAAIAIAVVVAALAFALWHEAGPDPSSLQYFATRTLIPGAGMSVAFFAVGPSFIIAAHGTAHVLMPALFV